MSCITKVSSSGHLLVPLHLKTQNGCITYIKYINIGTLKEYAAGDLVIYAYFNDHSDPRRLLWQCFL